MINKQDLLNISNNAEWIELFLVENIHNMTNIPYDKISNNINNCRKIQMFVRELIREIEE